MIYLVPCQRLKNMGLVWITQDNKLKTSADGLKEGKGTKTDVNETMKQRAFQRALKH